MKRVILAAVLGAIATVLVTGSYAVAKRGGDGDGGKRSFKAELDGWQEDPSQVTVARGEFRARVVNPDLIEFRLSYSGLEGAVQQAHIHIGSHHESGGISAWLCKVPGGPAPAPPAMSPEENCPQSGELNGFIERRDITGPAGQGVEPGNMEDLLRAMRNDEAYANVHTSRAPGGEIRGDLGRGHHRQH